MQRVRPQLEPDAVCGTLCTNRIWYGRSLLESHHSSSTHSLTEIGPRTTRNGGQASQLRSRNDSSGGAEMHACISGKQRVAANCNLFAEIVCLVPPRVPQRLKRCTWYDDETWIWPCEASETQSTLVSRSDRARTLRTGHSAQRTETPPTSARRHRGQTEPFISQGCWEWTRCDERWVTVESGADDTMKRSGGSRRDAADESQRHGRMSAEALTKQAK